MSEHETRDLMSVDSFSQLPFIRPSPSKSSNSNSAVRIFGFEFPQEPSSTGPISAMNSKAAVESNSATASSGSRSSRENVRKFECHYCCRNFPTSQALGGHQNAHKRERQLAKRLHFQSAMAAHQHHHTQIADSHVCGILNYYRLGSSPFSARSGLEPSPRFTSWSSGGGSRFYSGLGSISQPFNGNPLAGLWRVPNCNTGTVLHRGHRSMPLPLFGDHEPRMVELGEGDGGGSSSSFSSAFHPHAQCESLVKNSVSVDLHL